MRYIIALMSIFFLTSISYSKNLNLESFSTSKKLLFNLYDKFQITKNRVTLYCGCTFKNKKPNFSSCGYTPRINNKRANRIEWEHVVPVSVFGKSFPEWENGHPNCIFKNGEKYSGRKCLSKVNKDFKLMQADMHNLFPAIGEVNQKRNNYMMSIIKGENREYGDCDLEIKDKKIEPRETVRGEIARTYLYMDFSYFGRVNLSKKQKKMFEIWSIKDPVDDWECIRAKQIEKIQGNQNIFVLAGCK